MKEKCISVLRYLNVNLQNIQKTFNHIGKESWLTFWEESGKRVGREWHSPTPPSKMFRFLTSGTTFLYPWSKWFQQERLTEACHTGKEPTFSSSSSSPLPVQSLLSTLKFCIWGSVGDDTIFTSSFILCIQPLRACLKIPVLLWGILLH